MRCKACNSQMTNEEIWINNDYCEVCVQAIHDIDYVDASFTDLFISDDGEDD